MEQSSPKLETFENPHPDRDYEIRFEFYEFTSLCPKTGNPDFATVKFFYVPDRLCVEMKSLKLYLNSYRNVGAFFEDLTNRIYSDFCAACRPRRLVVEGHFNVRGGTAAVIRVSSEGAGTE